MRKRVILIVALAVGVFAGLALYVQPRLGPAPALGTGLPFAPRSEDEASMGRASLAGQESPLAADPYVAVTAKGIVVVGVGTARVAPDMALVTVGVQTRAQTAKEAQQNNNTTMTAVLGQIKALGIADQDIQTSGISLRPVMERENQVTGYQASNSVTVRVQDVNQAGSVLDAAVAGGANTAGSVRFLLKDSGAANQQALDAAAKDARAKADAIAKALGVQIKAVDSAIEETTGGPVPVAAEAYAVRDAASAVPIQPGEVGVTARLRVTYSY